jgi:hypothetical protein
MRRSLASCCTQVRAPGLRCALPGPRIECLPRAFEAGCGLVFLLCWPLYDPRAAWSACLCASVPALATAHFLLVGAGLQRDPDLVRSFTVCPRTAQL